MCCKLTSDIKNSPITGSRPLWNIQNGIAVGETAGVSSLTKCLMMFRVSSELLARLCFSLGVRRNQPMPLQALWLWLNGNLRATGTHHHHHTGDQTHYKQTFQWRRLHPDIDFSNTKVTGKWCTVVSDLYEIVDSFLIRQIRTATGLTFFCCNTCTNRRAFQGL